MGLSFPKSDFVHLAIDVQDSFTAPLGAGRGFALTQGISLMADDLRARGVPTVWVGMAGQLASLFQVKDNGNVVRDWKLSSLDVAPQDWMASKTRLSALSNRKLLAALKESRCKHIVISGLNTRYCVAATVKEALRQGWSCCAVYDRMGDGDTSVTPMYRETDPAAHRAALEETVGVARGKLSFVTAGHLAAHIADARQAHDQAQNVRRGAGFFGFSWRASLGRS